MNANLPLPKYHQVYLVLRGQLEAGQFAAGLPGELALAREYGVARVTVRRALEQLAAEGLIERSAGRATMPRKTGSAKPARGSAPMGGLLQSIVAMGERTRVKVVSCEILAAGAAVAAALEVDPASQVQKAVRVRATAQGPLSLITTFVPEPLARGFGRRDLARQPILVLLEAGGLRVGRASQSITARPADGEAARLLEVPIGSPLLAVTRLVRAEDDRPVQWLHGLYRPDRYHYEMQLSRVGETDTKVWVSTELSAQFH
ncbi:MAG: GntR family transcriptional regulator [Burkholderiales bacterium]|nr:GntR family transcriptional regulator [Burkholderiales bacterium]MDE2456611.1 GntR family transcriptional regulator [Burkholderiales bacterium]